MRKVLWPSRTFTKAEIWRVLDMAGFTSSVRQSMNALRAGLVYVDGVRIFRFNETVNIGKVFQLELKYPNGTSKRDDVMLVIPTPGVVRSNAPTTRNYRKNFVP